MLSEKFANAGKKVRRKRAQTALILFLPAALVGLFLVGILRVDFSAVEFGASGLTDKTEVEPVASPEQPVPHQSESPDTLDHEKLVDQHSNPLSNGNSSPLLSSRTDAEFREIFKEELFEFEKEVLPKITSESFGHWNKDQQQAIINRHADAISAFSSSEYRSALNALRESSSVAKQKLAEMDEAFSLALAKASAALEADDVSVSSLHITRALQLKPESPEAIALGKEIDQLPAVLRLISKAKTARAENDLQQEANHLERIIELDPSRLQLASRLTEIRNRLREQEFAHHISSGLSAIEQRNLQAAQERLTKAKVLNPNGPEVELLAEKVGTLAQELEGERLIDEARSASRADDWENAEALYREAGSVLPGNKDAGEGLLLAVKINGFKVQLSRHLEAAHRLSSINVFKQVRLLVEDAGTLLAHSDSLRAQVEKLRTLLEAYSKKVRVRVVSDGSTDVSVRGVGRVGTTVEKTIQLRPGKYVFEGDRPGYRSKSIEVQIGPGEDNTVVEIYCDERI